MLRIESTRVSSLMYPHTAIFHVMDSSSKTIWTVDCTDVPGKRLPLITPGNVVKFLPCRRAHQIRFSTQFHDVVKKLWELFLSGLPCHICDVFISVRTLTTTQHVHAVQNCQLTRFPRSPSTYHSRLPGFPSVIEKFLLCSFVQSLWYSKTASKLFPMSVPNPSRLSQCGSWPRLISYVGNSSPLSSFHHTSSFTHLRRLHLSL